MRVPTREELNRLATRLLALCLAALLSACSLFPQRTARPDYCREAAARLECSASCGDQQPKLCGPPSPLRCADWMCVGVDAAGNVTWAADLSRVTRPPVDCGGGL